MLGELAEGYQEFLVDGSGIIADGSDNFLDAEFSGAVKRRAARIFCGVLNLCSIDDMGVTVRGLLRFLGVWVIKLGAQVFDVVAHREAAGALDIVPSEVNSIIEVALIITCDFIVFFEVVEYVVGVGISYIFYAEVINYQGEQDRSTFVAPQTRGLGELVIVMFEKACLQ